MAGPIQRRKAGDKAENIWESRELSANPETEEDWAAWVEFNELIKKADGKGISDAQEKAFKGGYEGARGNYRDYVYENVYKDQGWSREQFDEAREKFKGGPAASQFREGKLGFDFDSVNALGDTAQNSNTLGEFQAKLSAQQAASEYDGISAPEIDKLDPRYFKEGSALDLQGFELGDAGPSSWEDFAGQDSIDYFRDVMDGGGKDAVSEAEFAQKRAQAEQADRAQREAGMRSMETQGLSGSGVELAGDLAGQQARTQSLYQGGLEAAAMAQNRRDMAGSEVYRMAGGQADALDAWGQWDTNRQDTQAIANSEIQNEMARDQTARSRFVGDTNVGVYNAAQAANQGISQQNFSNEMSLAGAKSGAGFDLGNYMLGADQFNQGMDWEQYKYESSQPSGAEKAMAFISAPLKTAGRVIGGMYTGGASNAAEGAAKQKPK